MNDDVKNRLEELKSIVLSLHRSAGQLDEIIMSIENEINNNVYADKEFLRLFIKTQCDYRNDKQLYSDLNELDMKERIIWVKLIEAAKKGS